MQRRFLTKLARNAGLPSSEIGPIDGEMGKTHLLITGFGPFPGMPINPSARLAEGLARLACWRWLGWRISAEILPVSYGATEKALAKAMDCAPTAILMFGVAGRAKTVRIEMVARNRRSRTQRDASGRLPGATRLDDGPTLMQGRAPFRAILQCYAAEHVPVRLSWNAGLYLCNAGYRAALQNGPAHATVLFIHIPRLKRPGDARGLDFARVLRASRGAAIRLGLAARLR